MRFVSALSSIEISWEGRLPETCGIPSLDCAQFCAPSPSRTIATSDDGRTRRIASIHTWYNVIANHSSTS